MGDDERSLSAHPWGEGDQIALPRRLCSLHGAENLEAEALVGSEDAAMGFEFAEGRQGHAEIDGAEGTTANDAFAPAFGIGDFFDLFV